MNEGGNGAETHQASVLDSQHKEKKGIQIPTEWHNPPGNHLFCNKHRGVEIPGNIPSWSCCLSPCHMTSDQLSLCLSLVNCIACFVRFALWSHDHSFYLSFSCYLPFCLSDWQSSQRGPHKSPTNILLSAFMLSACSALCVHFVTGMRTL